MRRPWGGPALVTASFVLLVGCGGSSAPSDDVPALGDALDRVDDAIVAGRYDDARSALDELVATATAGREEGELGGGETDRILAAASELSAALPEEPVEEPKEEPEPTTEPAPEETESSEPPPEEPSEEETQSEAPSEEDEEEQEELEKELDKEQKEAEKEAEDPGNSGGNGNGNSSENGPDDGEGN